MTGFLFSCLWIAFLAAAASSLGLLAVCVFVMCREAWWDRDRRRHLAEFAASDELVELCEGLWRLPAREPRAR
jgi:hypothetical protein